MAGTVELSETNLGVHWIEPAGSDTNQDLAGARNRSRDVRTAERRAGSVDKIRSHDTVSLTVMQTADTYWQPYHPREDIVGFEPPFELP
jgi:hypothetical protein